MELENIEALVIESIRSEVIHQEERR